MKKATDPAVRVSPKLRSASVDALQAREALSEFLERGLASAAAARKSGKYVPVATVLGKLARRLERARKTA